jgi:DNA-binding protein YbaB
VARDAASGEDLWHTRWDVQQTNTDAITRIHADEEGQGYLEGPGRASWRVRIDATFSKTDRRLASRREIQDESGQLLRAEERQFDYGAGTGRIAVTDGATGRTAVRQVSVEPTSIAAEMLATQLRLLPDTKGRRMRFPLITRDGKILTVEASILGQEMVTVPAGRFECYKIEIDPAGFQGLLADLFLPRIFMWHTVAAPHFWVRYQGPDEGRLSREIVRELTHFESHPAPAP